ncbi:MAG: hypothetical protein ACR2G0_09190 [Chthoniobacterales bacterium]
MKAPGYSSPLNHREISHLIRAGHLDRRAPCKRCDEATWRTVGDLFPFLKSSLQAEPAVFDTLSRRQKMKSMLPAVLLAAVIGSSICHLGLRKTLLTAQIQSRSNPPGTETLAAIQNVDGAPSLLSTAQLAEEAGSTNRAQLRWEVR